VASQAKSCTLLVLLAVGEFFFLLGRGDDELASK
jgi:hypothetical protein